MLRTRLTLVSMVIAAGALAVSAVGATSASALEWHECRNVGAGNGKYESSTCAKEGGSKEFEWKPVETAKEVTEKSSANFPSSFLEGVVATAKLTIVCKKNKGTGEIKAAGESKGKITFEECGHPLIINKTSHAEETLTACTVANIPFNFLDQLVAGKGLGPEDEFKPAEGKLFVEIEITGTLCALPKKNKVEVNAEGTGVLGALPASALGLTEREIAFTSTGDEHLRFANEKASFYASEEVKTTGGEAMYAE
jgi:hypothetical protein